MRNKNKTARVIISITAVIMLLAGFSVTAYASMLPTVDTTEATAEPTSTPEPTLEPTPAPVPTSQPPASALTPDGNLTLVDDILAIDKQITTVVTKSGNYFYIVIDRSGDSENVYFLNLVDESDLMAIIEGKPNTNDIIIEAASATPAPVSSPEVQPAESAPTTPANTTTESKGSTNTGSIMIIVLLIAAAGGGAFYYFRILKPKQGAAKGASLPELAEYEFEDGDELINDEDDAEQEPLDEDSGADNEQEGEDE